LPASSAPVSESSAPVSPAQRATGWHETNKVNPDEPTERENPAADAATTDPLSLAARSGENNGGNGNNENDNGAAEGTATEKATTAPDIERILRHTFPSAHPNEKAVAACLDRIGEALRLGATCELLAWAVQSKKAQGKTPWDRFQEAGERAADLLSRARRCWPACSNLQTIGELLVAVSENYVPRNGKERGLIPDVQAWRQLATQWPPDGRT
jgi:hypothetical protein